MIRGRNIAITGKLLFYKRKDAFTAIKDRGGSPQNTVTHETDYLVVGTYKRNTLRCEKSKKYLTAEKYISHGQKIRILREEEFLHILWSAPIEENGGK